MNAFPRVVASVLITVCLCNGCTEEKTYITNNPPTDQRPPTVEWVSINSGVDFQSAVSDTVEIVFLARDDSGIDSARLYIDGVIRFSSSSSTSTSSFTFTWNTLNDSDGVHSVEARAWDKAGNSGETPVLLLHVSNRAPYSDDRTPPFVQWLSPAGGSTVADTVTLTVQAFDSSGIDSVRLYLDGFPRVGWASSPTDTSQAGRLTYAATFEWNTLSDSDGVYVLEARAWDEAGNVGFCPALVVRVHNSPTPPPEDRTPPSIEWLLPRGGGAVQGEITLSVKAVDSAGVSAVWISKNGYAPADWRFVGREDSLYSVQWNTRNDSDGVYSLEARAWDEAGNLTATPSIVINITNCSPPPEDRIPPRIRWLSPTSGSTIRDTVKLEFEASDNVGIDSLQLFSSGELAGVLAGQIDFHYILSIDTWRFINGSRVFEVRVYDAAGNVGISEPISLTVDNHRVIWAPDDYPTIQGAINASADGDTVRVRDGVYAETLDLLRKRIVLESEHGPDMTVIDASTKSFGILVFGGQDSTLMIRGFKISGAVYGIEFMYQSSARFTNNIIVRSSEANVWAEWNQCIFSNNVFADNNPDRVNLQLRASQGRFENNMLIRSGDYALWNIEVVENPLIPEYNLFWQYDFLTDPDPGFRLANNNLIGIDPMLSDTLFHLLPRSPCIDAGDPNFQDPDGSRSDIGAYGGPYAYPPPR